MFVDEIMYQVAFAQPQGGQSGGCAQARNLAAVQLMWACGTTACALRVAFEWSFIHLERMDNRVCYWLVVFSYDNGIQTNTGRFHKI